MALSRLHHHLFLFCLRSSCFFVCCSARFTLSHVLCSSLRAISFFFAIVVYSAPGWSSGSRLQSEANPAPLAEPKELRFYLPPTYIQGAYEIGSSAVTCGCTGGDGGRGSSRLDHGKIPPRERVPLPLPPCPRAGLLAALWFGWFVVPLRFTSLSPSCSLPSPSRLGLSLVFIFSPSLLFSLFSHLWLWASSGAPRQL